MIRLVGTKYYDFDQLIAELALAGIPVSSLGTDGSTIFTYDANSAPTALPAGATQVIAVHVPGHLQRDLVALQLQPAVGQSVLSLSTDLLSLLIAGLAYQAGAIDRTSLAVLPPGAWMV